MRDRNAQDVEGEVDIDGDDEGVFGDPQFTEVDVVPLSGDNIPEDAEHDQLDDDAPQERKSLRDLVNEGRCVGFPEMMREGSLRICNSGVPNPLSRKAGTSSSAMLAFGSKLVRLLYISYRLEK